MRLKMTQQFSLKEFINLSILERAKYIIRLKQYLGEQYRRLTQDKATEEEIALFNKSEKDTLFIFLSSFNKLKTRSFSLIELVEVFHLFKEADFESKYLKQLFLDDSCELMPFLIELIANQGNPDPQIRLKAVGIFEFFAKEHNFKITFQSGVKETLQKSHITVSLFIATLLGKKDVHFDVNEKRLSIQEERAIAEKFYPLLTFEPLFLAVLSSYIFKTHYPSPKNDIKNYFGCLFQLVTLSNAEFIKDAFKHAKNTSYKVVDFIFNTQKILDDELQPYEIYNNQPEGNACFSSESLESLNRKIIPILKETSPQEAYRLINEIYLDPLLKMPIQESLSLLETIPQVMFMPKHSVGVFLDMLFSSIILDIDKLEQIYPTLESKHFAYLMAFCSGIGYYNNPKHLLYPFREVFADKVFSLIMNRLDTHSCQLLKEIQAGADFIEEDVLSRGKFFRQQMKLIKQILKNNPTWQVLIERFNKIDEMILCAVKERKEQVKQDLKPLILDKNAFIEQVFVQIDLTN